MFKGFKLEQVSFPPQFYDIGKERYDKQKRKIQTDLELFALKDNSLDGSKIIESWFPYVNSHIFISHSHKDEKLVIAFAGWLYHCFGIESFIDSCIWGYSNQLIKILDDKYSWLDKRANLYNYQEVLYSTSHVHMMLSTALNSMIDKTECLIFFDSPHSIISYENIDKTESPWIYSEIAFSQMARINIPDRLKIKQLNGSRYFSADGMGDILEKASLNIKYDLYSKHLTPITAETLNTWKKFPHLNNPETALDNLYNIALKNKQILIG